MNKMIIVGIVVLVIIAAAAFTFLGSSSEEPVALAANAEEDQAVQNTVFYASLVSGGIDDPFVNIDENQALAMYELPEGFNSSVMHAFVIGAAAQAGGESAKFVSVQYVNGEPSSMWAVSRADFDALVEGALTDEQYEAKIEKNVL